jgi:FkbM family methyltransferase
MGSQLRLVARRLFWSALRLLNRIGITLRPIATARRRFAGIRLQWSTDDSASLRGIVVHTTVDKRELAFFVNNEFDVIQRVHLQGRFYAQEELDIIARYFRGGVFVDVGSNVGNHVLYAAKVLDARKVIAFEPNPAALRILEMNILANGLQDRVVVHPVGLSNKSGWASLSTPDDNNLGATRLSAHAGNGGLRLVRGDELLATEPVDFIKIDTEGLELCVLDGLTETLRAGRPEMFIEVAERNIPAFRAFCTAARYATAATYKRYPGNTNFLVVPADGSAQVAARRFDHGACRASNGGTIAGARSQGPYQLEH